MTRGIGTISFIGLMYYGGSFLIDRFTKWGKLTSSGFFQKILAYSILFNTSNYYLLVRNSEEIDLMFKHHKIYEDLISEYE